MTTKFFDSAFEFYGDPKTASRVEKIAQGTFRMRVPRVPKRLKPPPAAGLGRLLSLEVMGADGTLYVYSWKPSGAPRLFWSEEYQAYMAFPGSKSIRTGVKASEWVARRASKRWNKRWNRPGGKKRTVTAIPTPKFVQKGAAVRVVYRSPFGKHDDWQHFHDPGVRAFIGPGLPPSVIFVRGGRLRMTRRGLEH
jgi:hypothetical protein